MWCTALLTLLCVQSSSVSDLQEGQGLVPCWLGGGGFLSVSELEPEMTYRFAHLYIGDRATEAAIRQRARTIGVPVYTANRHDYRGDLERVVIALGKDGEQLVRAVGSDPLVHGFARMGTIDPVRSQWMSYMPHRYMLLDELDALTNEPGLAQWIRERLGELGISHSSVCRITERLIDGKRSLDVFATSTQPIGREHCYWFQVFDGERYLVADVPEAEKLTRSFLTSDGHEIRG